MIDMSRPEWVAFLKECLQDGMSLAQAIELGRLDFDPEESDAS